MSASVISEDQDGTAIIVVNYKTAAKVVAFYANAKSMIGESSGVAKFVIIDNASGDDDTSLLKKNFKACSDVVLILSEVNHGYSRGNNIGLKRAADLKLKYSMIVNSDIRFATASFVDILCENYRRLDRCGLIGPKILLPDGSEQPPIKESTLINAVFTFPVSTHLGVQPVYATTGCCIFGATATFHMIGLFDEQVFLYREEWMLAERLRASGLSWYYIPSVQVIHYHERKLVPLSRLMTHKGYEFQSTLYFFKKYRRYSSISILSYCMLFSIRLAIFLVYFGVKGFFKRKLQS